MGLRGVFVTTYAAIICRSPTAESPLRFRDPHTRATDKPTGVRGKLRHGFSSRIGLCVLIAGCYFSLMIYSIVAKRATIGPLQPEEFYAIEQSFDHAVCDLMFSENARYVLVLGSLGKPDQNYQVVLTSDGVSVAAKLPVSRIDLPALGGTCSTATTSPTRQAYVAGTMSLGSHFGSVPSIPASSVLASVHPRQEFDWDEHPIQNANVARDFHVHVTDGDLNDAKQYVRIRARRVAEGNRVRVFLDRQQKPRELPPDLLPRIVEYMEHDIMPAARRRLGESRDIDHDGKLAILLTPWLGRLRGGHTSVGGFVRGSDFQTDLATPFSNRSDVLYLNSNVKPGPHLRDLLAHEYTHAVCFSQRLSESSGSCLPPEEDWLNEAIAHLAEIGGTNIDFRISRFLDVPAESPLVVPDYYRAGLWRDHGCRGATYLFLKWCVDQFGTDLPRGLVLGSSSGVRNLEVATGRPFEQLFRRWSIFLFQSGRRCPQGTQSPTSAEAASPSLRGRLRDWGFVGPKCEIWDVSSPRRTINLKGSSIAYLELHSVVASPGCQRIRVQGERGSKLQISIVKLAERWPRITIDAKWRRSTRANLPELTADSPKQLLDLYVWGSGLPDLQVEMVAYDRRFRSLSTSSCFTAAELQEIKGSNATPPATASTIRLAQQSATVAPRFLGTFALPVSVLKDAESPLNLKVMARDAAGRRAVARAIVDVTHREPSVLTQTGRRVSLIQY